MDTFGRDGLHFDVRDHGRRDGIPVVALHGFPQDSTCYDQVAERLVPEGVRVLSPDQRGYSPGARPPGRRPYVLRELVRDVVALLDAAGLESAHVLGHDWGGAVAWTLAHLYPRRIRSLTVLSTPAPSAVRAALLRSAQGLRSAYMVGFQLPAVPEALLTARDGVVLRNLLRSSGLPHPFAEHYTRRMCEPGALAAALAWYRALTVTPPEHPRPRSGPPSVPYRYVWASRDPFFSAAAAERTRAHIGPSLAVETLDAGHWLPETRPDDVAAAVVRSIAASG